MRKHQSSARSLHVIFCSQSLTNSKTALGAKYRQCSISRTLAVMPGRLSERMAPSFSAGNSKACNRQDYQPRTVAKISGATMDASDSMTNFGVLTPSFPQVIFSFGTAPE